MAVSAVVGIATGIGAGVAFGFAVPIVAAGFALGAGFAALSKALVPKVDLGSQMRGTTVTTRDPAGPRKLIYGKARVGGNVVFITHSGTDNKYLNLAVAFATHEIEAYDEIWFNDNKIWTSSGFEDDWGTYVTIDRKFGTASQAASSILTASSPQWNSNHKLSGIAYIAFKMEWNQDKFPQGVPNITATIRGKKVYDPRTDTTAYSANPALCVRDYLLDKKYGLGESADLIDSASLIAAANICDQQVSLSGGGSQDRYQCNGVLDTTNQIKSNIENMLSSMGGNVSYSNGKYFVRASAYYGPDFSFDESNTVSAITIQTKQSRRSLYNGVKGTFVSEEKNYKVMDYPAQLSSSYEVDDGDPIYLDMPLPFVTNNLQAQRLAKVALLKSRQQVVINVTVNLSGLAVKVGDTVNISNDRLGYNNKLFEITDYEMVIDASGDSGVSLTLIETAAAVYDWTTSDEQDFLAGGELDLYDGRTVDNVTSLTKTEIGLQGPDGRVLSSVELAWTPPDDAFVDFYKIRYNKTGSTNYFHIETKEPRAFLSGLDISSNYDFRVQVQNLLGVTSSGTTLANQSLSGDTTAPGVPTNTSATGGVKTISVEWDNPLDIDFKHTEVYVNTVNSIPATPAAKVDGEEYIVSGLSGAQTRYFWLKAVDFSGNKSAATASFSGTSVVTTPADIADGAVTTVKIADDAVTNDKIVANSITTNKLRVTGRGAALNSDPNVQDSTAWVRYLGSTGTFTTVTDGEVGSNVIRSGTPGSAGSWYNGSERMALDPSKTYRMTALARRNLAADGRLFVGVAAFDVNGNNISGAGTQWSYGAASNVTGSTTFTRYSMEFGAGTSIPLPSNGVTFAPLVILNYQSTAGYYEAQDIRIEEKTSADLIVDGAITAEKIAVGALQADNITGDVSEHFPFALGQGVDGASMFALSSSGTSFIVDLPAPSGGVSKKPYINGVAVVDTTASSFDFKVEIRLLSGATYTHTFTGYKRAESSPYGDSSIKYNIYSGNQTKDLALGGTWVSPNSSFSIDVYGFFYDQGADETYLIFDEDVISGGPINFENGTWTLTPSSSTLAPINLCYPRFGCESDGEKHTVPFFIVLPESSVATSFMVRPSGVGFIKALSGEAGYLR